MVQSKKKAMKKGFLSPKGAKAKAAQAAKTQELQSGDHVTWCKSDKDVAAGEVGVVQNFKDNGSARVKFSKGTWAISPSELSKVADSSSSSLAEAAKQSLEKPPAVVSETTPLRAVSTDVGGPKVAPTHIGKTARKLYPGMKFTPRCPHFAEYIQDMKHLCPHANATHNSANLKAKKIKAHEGLTLSGSHLSKIADDVHAHEGEDGHETGSAVFWMEKISLCDFRAAKATGAVPKESCMPSLHQESFFEPITAAKAAELSMGLLDEADVRDLLLCKSEAAGGGEHELCVCKCVSIDTSLGGPHPWVCSYVDGQCTWSSQADLLDQLADHLALLRERREIALLEVEADDIEHTNWHRAAMAASEEFRRRSAVGRIEKWWLQLWEEDFETMKHTHDFLNSDSGNDAILQYLAEECVSCGNLFMDDAAFCRICGVPRPGASADAVTSGIATFEMCSCGNIFLDDADFCRKCGAQRVDADLKIEENADIARFQAEEAARLEREAKQRKQRKEEEEEASRLAEAERRRAADEEARKQAKLAELQRLHRLKEEEEARSAAEAEAVRVREEREYQEWRSAQISQLKEVRRRHAANTIARWWIQLWEEDFETLQHTYQFMESEAANDIMAQYLAVECVDCGNVFMDDAVFCRQCGTKRPGSTAMEAIGVSDEGCKKCGNVFMDDAVFCRKCGEKREVPQASSTDDSDDFLTSVLGEHGDLLAALKN